MKGLFLKDLKLMLNQKRFLALILVICICFSFTDANYLFILNFLSFVFCLIAITTISYDEFDEGNLYLFTLPFSRKQYVIEKFLLGLISGVSGIVIGIIIVALSSFINGNVVTIDLAYISLFSLLILFLVISIMLPIEINFSGDKSRIVLIIVFGIILLMFIGIKKILELNNIDISNLITNLNATLLLFLITTLIIIGIFISILISLHFIQDKEF
ncbi:MAG: ABC-2 transporter permease [Bacilli bacterium]|nr:ABC-2 transporter permease [Bacilli bacterium]